MKNSRFEGLNMFGGFLVWVFIKFCRTKLSEEQQEKNVPRNILVFCISIVLICFLNFKFFNF